MKSNTAFAEGGTGVACGLVARARRGRLTRVERDLFAVNIRQIAEP